METETAKSRLISAIIDFVESTNVPITECDPEFIVKMISAMMVSYHKYGALAVAYPHKFRAIDDIRARVKSYLSTGNSHFLVDAANFAMIESIHPSQDAKYLTNDSEDSPGRVCAKTRGLTHRDNAGNRIHRHD